MSVLTLAQEGNREKLEEFLELHKDTDLDIQDLEYGQTPISWASENGHKEVVGLLLQHSADVNIVDNWSQGPLHWAAWRGHFEIVESLLNTSGEKPRIDQQNSTGQTPISFAAEAGHEKCVELLLKYGADVEIKDKTLQGPLHWAAKKGEMQVVRLLLDNVNVQQHLNDQESDSGQTAVSLAAEQGHKELVNFLLERGADVTIPDSESRLPLNLAGMAEKTDVVYLLLGLITDIKYKDTTGRTLLSWAAEYPGVKWDFKTLLGHHEIESLDNRKRAAVHYAARGGSMESLDVLLENEVKYDEKDISGLTPLSLAAREGYCKLVRRLCEKNGDVNSQDNIGFTPLMNAAFFGHSDCVNLLLKAKADKEYRDDNWGQSALAWAVENQHLLTVKELIKAGCDFYSKNVEGETPVAFAVRSRVPEVLKAIIEHEYDSASDSPRTSKQQRQGPYIRTRAVEEALFYCLLFEFDKNTVLTKGYLNARDLEGRSLVSWAAERGDVTVFEALTDQQGIDWDMADGHGRTPLSLAAEKGHLAVVNLLLGTYLTSITVDYMNELAEERAPKKRQHDGKTFDKKMGAKRSEVAKLQEGSGGPIKSTHDGIGNKSRVEVNSLDQELLTPLDYAAMNNHVQVVGALLDRGANAELSRNVKCHDKIDKKVIDLLENKRNDGKLATRRLDGSDIVDEKFRALAVHFRAGDEGDFKFNMLPVQDLLDKGDAVPKDTVLSCKWLHLPANNMRWVEVLMAKHFMEAGPEHQMMHRNVLDKNWTGHQHRTHKPWPYHSRFMRPDCQLLPLISKKETIPPTNKNLLIEAGKGKSPSARETMGNPPEEKKKKTTENRPETGKSNNSSLEGFVLFMPYLHWERQDEFDKLKEVMNQKVGRLKINEYKKGKEPPGEYEETARKEAIDEIQKFQELMNGTEKMYWMYLDQQHPLHPRRTLDQYYYHTLDDTSDRDCDQTATRYYEKRKAQFEKNGIEKVLTMVDQLWIQKRTTALIDNILSTCSNIPPRRSYDLARIIAAECGRIYLDRTSRRDDSIQFYDIYSTSIADLTHDETNQFDKFQKAIENLKTRDKKLRQAREARAKDTKDSAKNASKACKLRGFYYKLKNSIDVNESGRENAENEWRKVLEDLVDIEQDIKNLKEIKDIQDELNIMLTVFTTQENVIETMEDLMQDDDESAEKNVKLRGKVHSRPSYSSPLTVVKNNIREVKSLMDFAQKTSEAMNQLLDLKNKQANVLEEGMTNDLNDETRKLTKQILDLNRKTDRQGVTLMAFTFITTLFLPLSFMTSFFALNIAEFPRSGPNQMLSLSFVSKYTFAVSVAFIIGFAILAFNMRWLGGLFGGLLRRAILGIVHFLRRGRQKTGDPEGAVDAGKSGTE